MFLPQLHHIQHPENIYRSVILRVCHGFSHVHLCGVVVNDLDICSFKDSFEGRVLNVHFVELCFWVDVFDPSTRKIVHDDHVVTCLNVRIDDVGAYKSRAPGH